MDTTSKVADAGEPKRRNLESWIWKLAVVVAVICPISWCQVSGNVYQRILLLKTRVSEGTAFTIDVNARQYLVTAKHMVAGQGDRNEVSVFRAKEWKSISVRIFRCKDPIDIAVLIPDELLTRASSLQVSSGANLFFGQDVLFLGFPFGWSMEFSNLSPDPIAIVKKGVLSAVVEYQGAKLMLLDGYNNFGFSGGPIVYHDLGKPGYDLAVAGVISGFQPELRPVVKPRPLNADDQVSTFESWRVIKDKNGNSLFLGDTGEFVPVNTGFLRAFDIGYALELIREHPVGPKIAP